MSSNSAPLSAAAPPSFALKLNGSTLTIAFGADKDERNKFITITGDPVVLQKLVSRFGPGLHPETDDAEPDQDGNIAMRKIGGCVSANPDLRTLFFAYDKGFMLISGAANSAVREYDNAGALVAGTAGAFSAPLSLCFLE